MQYREQLMEVLQTYVKGDVLIKHSLAVEAAMRAYAQKFGENEAYWGAVGLLHDIDFELFPGEHPEHAPDLLRKHGFDDVFIQNVVSHARDWEKQRTLLQRTLLAVDETTGFVIACALVRPDKSLSKLEVKSVIKKMKDKAFARSVNRDTIRESAIQLGMELSEHIGFVTQALATAVEKPEYERLKFA